MDPFKTSFDSLEELADTISDVLKCPITIEDANHRLMAYSTHDDRTDQARISTIIGRRVPEKVINSLWKDGVIPKLLQTRDPVRIPAINQIGLGDRVAISIWKDEEVLGFIWAIEIDKQLSPTDLELFKKAANAAKHKLLQLQIRRHRKEERAQELFWKLLTGHAPSGTQLQESLQQLQITAPPYFSVMVFEFTETIHAELEKQILYSLKTSQRLNVLFYTTDVNQLILMTESKYERPTLAHCREFTIAFIEHMADRFNVAPIIGGHGLVYEQLQDVARNYSEAKTVIQLKRQLPGELTDSYGYHELGAYQWLQPIHEYQQTNQYEPFLLRKISDYDKKHNSNLVETLDVYLTCDSNVQEAAKRLNVHMNTLSYRLKRISEIGEFSLKDVHQKIGLYLAIKLAKLKERAPQ